METERMKEAKRKSKELSLLISSFDIRMGLDNIPKAMLVPMWADILNLTDWLVDWCGEVVNDFKDVVQPNEEVKPGQPPTYHFEDTDDSDSGNSGTFFFDEVPS